MNNLTPPAPKWSGPPGAPDAGRRAHWTFGRSRARTGPAAERPPRVNGPSSSSPTRPCSSKSTTTWPRLPSCHRAVRRAATAPEHIHTYRVTPLGLWNARAAAHDAEQVVDALVSTPATRAARAPRRHRRHDGRYGRLTLLQAPRARPRPHHDRPARARGGPPLEAVTAPRRRPHRPGHRRRAPLRARTDQADAAQARRPAEDLAGYVDGEATRSSCRGRLRPAAVPEAGRRELLARRLRRGRPPRAGAGRRSSAPVHGRGEGHHADPRHQHRLRPAVEARAGEADLAHRGRDRRVQRYEEEDPPRHHRHLPGADHPAEGRLPTWSSSTPATGASSSTTRCTCCPPPSSSSPPTSRPGGGSG
ncbi:hypothetical protein SALBM217S_01398 [Streptomyces griseoloalbus]